jgi:signal transduction histidine kinase
MQSMPWSGRRRPDIETTSTTDDPVRISDTGCGIALDKLDEIFEPFFTTKEPGKGTGLGLYNVKTIVNKMHGAIAIDSQIDRGTTFTLTFPKAEPAGQGYLS